MFDSYARITKDKEEERKVGVIFQNKKIFR